MSTIRLSYYQNSRVVYLPQGISIPRIIASWARKVALIGSYAG